MAEADRPSELERRAFLGGAALAGVALAWAGRYGKAPHPFACVVTPKMPLPGATVMADFWFHAG
jgi:hypothetical protein